VLKGTEWRENVLWEGCEMIMAKIKVLKGTEWRENILGE
jgi:hypothetical protein